MTENYLIWLGVVTWFRVPGDDLANDARLWALMHGSEFPQWELAKMRELPRKPLSINKIRVCREKFK